MCEKGCSMLIYHNFNDEFLKTLYNVVQELRKIFQFIRSGKKKLYTIRSSYASLKIGAGFSAKYLPVLRFIPIY